MNKDLLKFICNQMVKLNNKEITTDDAISWDRSDTYKIYKTSAKDSLISSIWTDSSRGWKSDKEELSDGLHQKGWRKEDLDVDRDKPGRVFGPGQPSKER